MEMIDNEAYIYGLNISSEDQTKYGRVIDIIEVYSDNESLEDFRFILTNNCIQFDLNYEGVLLPYYIEDIKANCSNNDYYEGIVSICEKLIKSLYSDLGYRIERNRILNLNAKSSYSRSTIKLGTILLSIAKSIGASDTYGND